MTALYIIGGVLLFFVLVALIRVRIRIAFLDSAEIGIKVLFFTFRLVPKKKKPVRLSDFEIKKFRRHRLRQLEKERKKLLKKQKKAEKEKKKKSAEAAEGKEKEKKNPVDQAKLWLDTAKSVLPPVLGKFGKHIYIRIDALAFIIRGKEPDKTAVTFGEAAQIFAYLSELLNDNKKIVYGDDCRGRYGVAVDFNGDKTSVDIDVTLGMRIWQVFATGITAYRNLPSGAAGALGIGGRKKPKKGNAKNAAEAGEEDSNGKQHE